MRRDTSPTDGWARVHRKNYFFLWSKVSFVDLLRCGLHDVVRVHRQHAVARLSVVELTPERYAPSRRHRQRLPAHEVSAAPLRNETFALFSITCGAVAWHRDVDLQSGFGDRIELSEALFTIILKINENCRVWLETDSAASHGHCT